MGDEAIAGGYKTHPAADVFPMMEGAAFGELVEDIRAKGLMQPIVMVNDRILDGRNRARACAELGIEPRFVQYDGDDPVGYVVSLNLARRHLDESQRAMVAGRIANLGRGNPANASIEALGQDEAAAKLNVGRASVQRARVVLTKAVPEVVAMVDAGKMAVSAAEPLARLPEDTQREIVAKAEGNARKVRDLVREAGGHAPKWASEHRQRETQTEPLREPVADAPMTERQRAARNLDERVREMWKAGETNTEIAQALNVSPSTVGNSLRRLGIVKKLHPIQSFEKRARETAADFASFMNQPEMYRDGSDPEDREACVKSLRALMSAASKAINWLNKEAIGG